MSHVVFNCAECSRPLKLPVGLAKPGDLIICPCCDKKIRVPQTTSRALEQMPTVIRYKRPHQPPPGKPEGENLFFDCPECKNPLKLPPGIAEPGGRVECPKCNQKIRVPSEKDIPPRQSPTIVKSRIEEKTQPTASPPPDKLPAQTSAQPKLKTKLAVTAGFILIAAIALLVSRVLIVKRCTDKIERGITLFASCGDISYGDIVISPLGRNLKISDMVIKPHDALRPVSISFLNIKRFSPGRGLPSRLVIKAYGVHVPLYTETFGKAGPAMRGLDYHCLHAGVACSYQYNPEEKTMTIEQLRILSPEVGNAELSLVVSGIDLTPEALSFEKLLPASRYWQIVEGQFEYQDDSFIPRFLAYQARYIGEPLADLQAAMGDDLAEVIRKEADSFTRASLVEFGKFLENPSYIRITATPAEPRSMAQLQVAYDEEGIKGLIPGLKLNFSVDSHSKKKRLPSR